MSKRSLPLLQFYPSDCESDSIAGCSLPAQGLWLRMICVMHTSQPYRYLEIDGRPIPDELIFRRCGCVSVEEYRNLLAELFSAGVPSRTPEGVIYSRRMAAISKNAILPPRGKDSIAGTLLSRQCHREKSEVKVISQRQNQRKSNSLRRPLEWSSAENDM